MLILGELLGEINYIIVRFLEYDTYAYSTPKPCILLKEKSKALVEKHEKHAARQALLYQVLKAKELLDKIPDPLLPLPLKLQIGP